MYFDDIILLLKLRWLLRLHSGCCELDYKLCSLRNLIQGMQNVATQQYAEASGDSGFAQKYKGAAGMSLNASMVWDDLVEQLHGSLGKAWRGFLGYVSSCDAGRGLHASPMDLTRPPIVSNESLAAVVDRIFLTSFLKTPRNPGGGVRRRLAELFEDLEQYGIPAPQVDLDC